MLLRLLREFPGYTLTTLRAEGTGLVRLLALERAMKAPADTADAGGEVIALHG
jgi:hypothetical protein